ncbi:AraC family transcriptional regulator [Paenibacillus polysaccharolyticus]|uniref:AraC family transcriptional regulator n=1 Tax=Paenibacillus polysaccharolyticus TaxID=582692 RepID=UPI00203EFE73|nr:AraC family transcriptional regulator [Paenibacillus polysaccharolyticus]MCM3134834.1 AraC family transcriptional regulator [Paenibacillus polysaccharolyticus]
MDIRSQLREMPYHTLAHWLPIIDCNIKFYGAHSQQVPYGWAMPEETHPGFEIILIIQGTQESVIHGYTYTVDEGSILLIPPGFKHTNACISAEGMMYFSAHFNVDDPVFTLKLMSQRSRIYAAGTGDNMKIRAVLESWMNMINTTAAAYSSTDKLLMQARMFELFALLSQAAENALESTIPVDATHAPAPTAMHYAGAIAEAIKQAFHAQLRSRDGNVSSVKVEQIIASFGISPGYGLQVFRKVFGHSPRAYLSNLKLQEAKMLIEQPDLSLGEIAIKLGYTHLSHFSRQFKRWTGQSPLLYRNQHAENSRNPVAQLSGENYSER